ncbi:hypothetical protein BLA29_000422 [Euroglyphus maynei]|uniref:Uncharacterized protein n=1 Tax=Euroglyphus maynei TaxID=6958 RepID=A0A1Y3BES8_EURMA|nr:hypothetical protein BLA29_000422 [Euroglyphus maynei]
MCKKIYSSIINLYINVFAIDVGEQFVRLMTRKMLNYRFCLLENFEQETEKLHLFNEEDDLDLEWKQWFAFDNQMCPKLRIYCSDRFDDELSLEMRMELKEMLANLNDSNKETLIERMGNFIIMIKTLQELWYVVESIHETIMKNGCQDYYVWLCEKFINSIAIFHESLTGKDLFSFQHLFSTKCRIIFFDFINEGIYQEFDDNIRMNNVELITKLCHSDSLPTNLMFICFKYLLKLRKKIHLECFIRMFQWYGFESFEELLVEQISPSEYIRSIFDDVDHLIMNESGLSLEMITSLKRIYELKKKLNISNLTPSIV